MGTTVTTNINLANQTLNQAEDNPKKKTRQDDDVEPHIKTLHLQSRQEVWQLMVNSVILKEKDTIHLRKPNCFVCLLGECSTPSPSMVQTRLWFPLATSTRWSPCGPRPRSSLSTTGSPSWLLPSPRKCTPQERL